MTVLVLNATYEPLNVVSIKRAIVLLLKEKAEPVENAPGELRSEKITFDRPTVIRLVAYVQVPRIARERISRRGVLARDRWQCQYCGAEDHLTLDHVLPRTHGGGSTWNNVVTACRSCNGRKGDLTLKEAGMKLRRRPGPPTRTIFVYIATKRPPEAWERWLIC